MPLEPGTLLLERYRIQRVLGQGGFGAVYLAFDEILEQPCAVKENRSLSLEGGRQFLKEARLLANLRHPNLPRVTHHFEIGKSQFLVMDFVEGEDLAQRLRRVGRLPLEEVLRWARQIGGALTYLHGLAPPVFHRDIKPANIKINPQGEAILVDFGIAKEAGPDQATSTGAKGVTPGYAPPEQYGLGHTDARTDVYALGATLYALLTDRSPPDSVQRLLGTVELPSPETITPDLPPHVVRAIQLAMRPGKEDRLPDVATLSRLLEDPDLTWPPPQAAEQEQEAARAAQVEVRLQRNRDRGWVAAGICIVLVSTGIFVVGARSELAKWVGPALRQVGLVAPGLSAAPAAAGSEVAPLVRRSTTSPAARPSATVSPTVTSIPTPTSVPVMAGTGNAVAWRPYGAWTSGEPSLIFSLAPDGETAAVVRGQGVDLVDPVTGEVKQALPPFLVSRTAYALAHRGDTLLVGVAGEILHWDVASENLVERLPIPGRDLRLSPSGDLLAVRDKYIMVLNLKSGQRLTSLGEPYSQQQFAISPDDRTFALTDGLVVALWDLEQGVMERRLVGHGEPTQGLAFTRDGSRLVSASGDVWDMASGELVAVFDSATDQIALSPNGELIIGRDGSVWDLTSGEPIGQIPFDEGTPGTLLFTADGRFLIRHVGATAQVWVVDPGAAARADQEPAAQEIAGEAIDDLNLYRLVRGEPLDEDEYAGFDVSPSGRAVAAWHGRLLRVFDLREEIPFAEFSVAGTVTDAAFLGDEFLAVVVGGTRTERWEVSSARRMQTYAVGGEAIGASPAGDTFAVRSKYIQVVESLSGEVVHSLGSADAGQDFVFTPDGRQLLIAAGPGVGVWDIQTGRLTRQLAGHGPAVTGLRVTPDGARAAAASGDVWDLVSGKLLASFDPTAKTIALSGDGRLVIDAGGAVWNATTGFLVGSLEVQLNQAAFALGDRTLVVLGVGRDLSAYRPTALEAQTAFQPSGILSDLPGLTLENVSRMNLLGWWGKDDLLSLRGRDGAPPRAVAFGLEVSRALAPSPDGVTVTALRQGGIDLLDPVRGTVVASYQMMLNPSWVEGIAYAGSELLVAKGRAGVERWDLQGQRLRQRYEIEAEAVGASPDRKWIAVQHGSRLQVIDFVSGETLLRDLAISTGGQLFAFTPDSRLLAVARGGFVDVWDLAERRRIQILRSQESSVGDLAFAPDGSRLIAASGTVWDVTDGQRLVEFASPSEAGALSADGSLLFEGAGGVWATDSGERRATLFDLRAPGDQVVLTGEGGVLVLRTAEGRLYVWSARPLAPEAKTTPHPQAVAASNAADLQRVGHLGRGRLREALWSPDDTFLAVNTTLNAIVYEAETLRRLSAYEAADVVAFAADNTVLVGGDRPLTRNDPRTGAVLEEFGLEGIHAAAYSPDGSWLALAGRVSSESKGDGVALMALSDGLLRVLDLGRSSAAEVAGLEFTSDSRRLVVSHPLAISLWDVATGGQVREPIPGTRRLADVSPDGATIAYQTPNWIFVESLDKGAVVRRASVQTGDFAQPGWYPPLMYAVDVDFYGRSSLMTFYRRVNPVTGDFVAAIVTDDVASWGSPVMRAESFVNLSHPTGTYTQAYEAERPAVIPAFGLSSTAERVFSLTADGIIRVWTISGRLLAETEPELLDQMALSPDGRTLAAPDALGGLQVLDLISGAVLRRMPGAWYPRQMWFSSPSVLTVLQLDGKLSQIDIDDGSIIESWVLEEWTEGDRLASSPDGRLMALFRRTAGRNQVLIFGLRPGGILLDLGRFPTASEPVFAPEGSTLALMRREAVELWDLQRGQVRSQIDGAGDTTGGLRFAPNGENLINGRGEIWATADGDKVGSVEGPLEIFVISPSGEVLIKSDGSVWDARDGRSLGNLEGVLSPAVQMAFTPDGRRLLWMRAGGVVEIWEIAP
jgi:serine/threonine-protein kinase